MPPETAETPTYDLTTLLCRGMSRLAIAAQGQDDLFDSLLAELRHELRGDLRDLARLARLIEAIEQRVKIIDPADHSVEKLRQALHRLIESLQPLQPSASLADLRGRLAGSRLQALSTMVGDVADYQERLLAAVAPRSTIWSRLFTRERESAERSGAGFAELDKAAIAPVADDVQRLLAGLLRQIEPPAAARDNHQQALEQLSAGLEWQGLAAVLEDVCLVVVAAMESDRGEYQQFLLMLNQRLVEAHRVMLLSREAGRQRRASNDLLQRNVQDQVVAMQAGVETASTMSSLKAEVTSRLDTIVSSLSEHRRQEDERETSLREQLQLLTGRIHEMEAESARIEQRMAEQRQLALIDTLTQLPNRQAYEERLQEEWARCERYGRRMVLALCDVDNFKSINDRFGHLAGDKVLRVIAKTVRSRLRRADFCARYGGEEFILLLPETTPENALEILEQLRQAVANCPFHFREQPVAVTLSAGLAAVEPDDNPGRVFQRADEALYRAKQAGRNRCVVATPATTTDA